MIRRRTYLEKTQAEGVMLLLRRNQILDLLVYVNIHAKNNKGHYRLCIDCPVDTFPRLLNKLLDILTSLPEKFHTPLKSLVWYEYDDTAVKPKETKLVGLKAEKEETSKEGLTAEFRDLMRGKKNG